jgi:hypothetical protein
MLASSAGQMVYTDPNRLNQPTIRGRNMKNLFAVIGVIVVVKKGYEFFREYNEMKQELEKRAGDSA